MSETMNFSEALAQLGTATSNPTNLLTAVGGELKKATLRNVADFVFGTIARDEDLDNPTTRGIFNVNTDTVITPPTKGTGWSFGYVINLAAPTGVQVWVNFAGYIAVRGKGSTGAAWTEWKVMQPMA